ncbi:cytokine receptor family member b1 [Cottoperca gobio]|uniref:Cytokine receptor family member b1 n=1 Tax=Cottoperca gobio TaxID=56716 RepID=A0A6J2RU31_COTGO|nr:interferon alpha/beta receptor 1a-like [Cottoperca gobio]
MNCLPLVLYLILLLDSVRSSLPAPVNLSISSVNFNHVLSWVPGPGTPPGTRYKINRRVNRKAKLMLNSNTTSIKLKLRNDYKYELTVQASYKKTLSPESEKKTFEPLRDTEIGPPKVSLAGCGNCIQINISLPEADESTNINDMKGFYGAHFKVLWRKPKEKLTEGSIITPNKSYTLNNLLSGTEYCVKVRTLINANRNTKPSAWNCTFSSIVEPSTGFVVLGAVAGLLIVVFGVLMSSMFCLYYTGFLCKLATLPRVLTALSQGCTLTPEWTIPDKISISAEWEKRRKYNNPTTPQQPATSGTDTDEEDGEGENIYMNRGAELSSGESSCQDSADALGNGKGAASEGSGSLTMEAQVSDTKLEVPHGGLNGDESNAERAEVSFMPDGPVPGEGEEEQVCQSSGNINLFSVTLASLAVCEEGEEEEEQNTRDSLTDLLKLSDLEPLLHTDSQTELDVQTTVTLLLTQEDFTEGRCADTLSGYLKTCEGETWHEETQEEEEFSEYMQHT